ncbi:MAG: DUF5676 family membrane protein [Halieaceae bacterium]|jgi:hypothetical protein|uniref:DUF5676 family membrane protein n=1 Tax=Haliea TaxID=475794 RepID=UPI000C431F2D|nr:MULTISPECIES: DUF5676 family membrane protein [Haliea]MCR9184799.1 DUF5676 family membrane protein [Halieaceae bacterium]MAD62727.1 hypothetical protein [Haliea sp.]MAY91645.1 hypothetical protein [Haliea sp.]MBK40628.1 hypothetical protein [Haliea sp.]MBP68727.1 hypothetical protein [Haliea sp.]|tara:strand:- start:852 stop:1133 length:282 start_codon:yes stop_codon:yes gene_type:complete
MINSNTPVTQLRVAPLGNTLSLFLVISYLLCVGFGLLAPAQMRMYEAWAPLLPGFEWLTWTGFFIGLVEVYLYGWYIAVLFVPLYRVFSRSEL